MKMDGDGVENCGWASGIAPLSIYIEANLSLSLVLFLHSCLSSSPNGSDCSALRFGRFTPWIETQYPLNGRFVLPQSNSGPCTEEKNVLQVPGFEPRTVPQVSFGHCTDWAILAPSE